MNSDHIRVSVDQWCVSIHDTERDDCDWPVLWYAGPTKNGIELANAVAAAVRERIDEYEQWAEEDHSEAMLFVEQCERKLMEVSNR